MKKILLTFCAAFALSAASALNTSAAAPASPDASAVGPAKADDQIKSLTAQLAAVKDDCAKQLAADVTKFDRLSRATEALVIQRDQNARLAQDAQLQLALALQEIEVIKKELAEAKAARANLAAAVEKHAATVDAIAQRREKEDPQFAEVLKKKRAEAAASDKAAAPLPAKK